MGRLGGGMSGTEVHFSHIIRTFLDLLLMCGVVLVHAAGGGFWGSHARHVRLSLLQFRIFYRWYLLHSLFCAAST